MFNNWFFNPLVSFTNVFKAPLRNSRTTLPVIILVLLISQFAAAIQSGGHGSGVIVIPGIFQKIIPPPPERTNITPPQPQGPTPEDRRE